MPSKKLIAAVIIVIVLAAIAYLYFGIISPLGMKPALQKPQLQAGQPVTSEHVNWVVNELGGYKLHPSISGEPPEIEAVVGDGTFSVTTENGKTVAKAGKAANPDIRITANYDALIKIFAASDIKAEIVKLYNEGTVTFEMLKDQATLALKGYKGIYDELQGKQS